jgi:ABC-2 type transport system permease protein
MSANIYKHEFMTRLKSVIIWSASITTIALLFFSIYPGFAQEAALINEVWNKFPPELMAAFGLDKVDFVSVLGYYGFLLVFVEICLAIQAGNYGFGLVSVEENELTADFLLSKPVSRAQIMTSKLLAALSSLLITTAVTWGSTFLAVTLFSDGHPYEMKTLILLLLSMPLFQIFFLGVGLIISLLVKRVRNVTPYSLGLGFGTYVLSAFSGMLGEVKLELITPFKHFDPSYIVQNGALNTPLVLLNVAVTVISVGVSYWLYIRRDVPAVS